MQLLPVPGQCLALCGVRLTVMPSVAVVNSTSPFWSQSNSRPMVLSSFAMYPSSDIDAIAMTFPMACSFASEVCVAPCDPLRGANSSGVTWAANKLQTKHQGDCRAGGSGWRHSQGGRSQK
jgi:hypothetical protein